MTKKPDIKDFEEAVNKYHKVVFRTALGFVHIKEDAEDLTQEVFLRAYRSWDKFRGDSEVSTWLYRITVNLSLSYIHISNRKNLIQMGEDFFRYLSGYRSSEPDPHQQMEKEEQERRIASAIDSLSDKQRTAFVLSRFDELPQKKVASIMGIAEGAVEQLLIRAKTNLKKKLEKTIGKESNKSQII